MARTMTIKIADDIDGSANAEGYPFSYDGQDYTIDLSNKNKSEMDRAMKPYLAAARKVSPARNDRRGSTQAKGRRSDLDDIRKWARANGHHVSDRGRIAASVVQEYDAAH